MPKDDKEESSAKEFLVLSVGLETKVGSSARVVAVERSLEKAKKAVEVLSDAGVKRVVIAEKKAVILRKPAIVIDEVDENVVKN